MKNLFTLIFLFTITNTLAQKVKDTSITPTKPKYNLEGTYGNGKTSNSTRKIAYHKTLNKDVTGPFNKAIIILKQKGFPDRRFFGFQPTVLIPLEYILSMEILRDKEAKKLSRKYVKYGVITLYLKDELEILNASELLERYKITNKFKTLPLYIDSMLVPKSDEAYYTTKRIKSVKVATEIGTNSKYISILSDIITYEPDSNIQYTR